MKIRKIAEGAYYVPTYYMPMVHTYVPGIINQGVSSRDPKEDVQEDEGVVQPEVIGEVDNQREKKETIKKAGD